MSTTVTPFPGAPARGLKRLVIAHPVSAFFVLALLGTWLFQLPMILSLDGLGLIQMRVPLPVFIVLFLLSSYAGPTLAALLITRALEGRAGVGRFLRRYVQWRVGIVPYLIVLFGFPLLWLMAAITQLRSAPWQTVAAQPLTFLTVYLPALLIFPAFITWGEEPGWRGFALTRMQESHGPLVASVVVGLVHGIWHLPNHLMVQGPTAAGPFNPVNFAINVALIVVVSVIFTWVFNMAGQSILIAVLIHASFNAAGAWVSGLVPDFPPAAEYVLYGMYVLAALVLVVATRGRLREPVGRSRPATEFWRSAAVWLALMAFVVAVKLAITYLMPALFRDPSQAAVFSWPALGIWTVAGLAGTWLALQTGFPGALSERVAPGQRFLLPALVGLAFGLAYVVFDLASGYSELMMAVRGQPSVNIDFPANVLIYPAGAIIVEVIYRLLPIPLLLWLVSKVILRGRGEVPIFWVLAALTSAIEPVSQNLGAVAMAPGVVPVVMVLDYALNFGQAVFFRKYGFLASIVARVAFYVVWHMIYVH